MYKHFCPQKLKPKKKSEAPKKHKKKIVKHKKI